MSFWKAILNRPAIEAHLTRYRSLDPARTDANRDWWLSRTIAQLEVERANAWHCNDAESYMLARSLLAAAEKEA